MIFNQHEILLNVGYVSPLCEVTDIQPEGVLCGSGNFNLPGYYYDDEDYLNF